MEFLKSMEDSQRRLAEIVLEEDCSAEEKLSMLEEIGIASEIIKQAKEFLMGKQTNFMSLVDPKKKRIAEIFLENKTYTALEKLIDGQSDACKAAYAQFKKANEGQEKPSKSIESKNKPQNSEASLSGSNCEEKSPISSSESSSDESSEEEDKEEEQWSLGIKPEFFDSFPQCLNILVLGETGVGKSTFINGLANYLKYNNMYEAISNGVEILIRSSFIHMDEDFNKMRIECEPTIQLDGEAENEDTQDGQSSTQSPKAYQFDWGPAEKMKTVRIIDTPGVGDVRGLEQEQMNFAKILSFIADYPEIHAILILMKPNESKLTVTYRYCINELLTHLHVSASKNILFCFTNARQTLYKPGDTLPALESHLQDLYRKRGVEVPLKNDTVYCFDNESFRFLCAWKQGAYFEDKDKDNFDKSWRTTVAETFRLFEKISQLPVHRTEETLSVNNIRQVVLAMARPLAEIAKIQMVNAQLIDDKVKEIDTLLAQGKSLSDTQLYVDQVVLTAKEINYPITVCTAESCVQMIKLNGTTYETYYKQKCHPHCYLTGVQTGLVPNPQIKGCACFYRTGITRCNVCSCDWTSHLHIRYELIKTNQRVVDPTVNDSIKNNDDKVQTAKIFIEAEKKKKAALEKEAATIRGHCAEFAAFLKKNTIIPYNDVYKEYVEHLIKEENGKVSQGSSNKMLLQLEKYRDEYAQQVKILESHGTKATSSKDIHEINDMLDELKRLKNCGTLLKEIEKLEMIAVRKEHTNRVTSVNIKKGWINGMYEGIKSYWDSDKKPKKTTGKKSKGKKSKKSKK